MNYISWIYTTDLVFIDGCMLMSPNRKKSTLKA